MKSNHNLQILVILMFSLVAVFASTTSVNSSVSIFNWLGEQLGKLVSTIASFVEQKFDDSTFFDCEYKCKDQSKYKI